MKAEPPDFASIALPLRYEDRVEESVRRSIADAMYTSVFRF